jgi:hypothetical protein
VAPEYRRRGVARRLVEDISNALFDKGAHRLSALVEHEHQWAIGLLGFLARSRLRARSEVRQIHSRPRRRQDTAGSLAPSRLLNSSSTPSPGRVPDGRGCKLLRKDELHCSMRKSTVPT